MAKARFITLFEAALLIGGYVDCANPEGLLVYSSGMFADGFLRSEIDPRHPLTLAKYSAFQPVPRAAVVIKAVSKTNVIPNRLGRVAIQEIPDLHWKITPKEAAEFAIANGYPESLFADLLGKTDYQNEEVRKSNIQNNSVEISSNKRHEDAINSLLKIVLGMTIDAYGYVPGKKPNKATGGNNGSIHAALEKIDGLATDADTIRKYLTDAVKKYPTAKPRKS